MISRLRSQEYSSTRRNRDLDRRATDYIAIGLNRHRRLGRNPEDATARERHPRMWTKILAQQTPDQAEHLTRALRHEHAKVKFTIVRPNIWSERESSSKDCPRVRDHGEDRLRLDALSIYIDSDVNRIATERRSRCRDGV